MFASEVNFVGNGTAIKLDFHNVRLLLTFSQQLLLSVDDHTDNLAIFLDLIEIFLNFLLSNFVFPLKTGFSESLLFRLGPLFFMSNGRKRKLETNVMLEHGFIMPF